jgi:hypothetical protein
MSIMENISENTPRKRGRPRKASAITWQVVDQQEGRHTSYRHRANYIYGMRAINVLRDDPRFAWLHRARGTTLLDALGRIDDDQNLIAMALYLCEHQPSTRQAVALIREFRLDTRPPGTTDGLQATLEQALETYLATHADMPRAAVQQALAAVVRHAQKPRRPRTAPLPPARTPRERLMALLQQHLAPDGNHATP